MTQANRRNYYRILHVQPDAPDAVIRVAYRTLMHKLRQHPDLGGDGATATLINEAHDVLSDPARRAAYDRRLASPQRTLRTAVPADASSAPDGPHCPYCLAGIPAADRPQRRCQVCASPLSPPPAAGRLNTARRVFERRAQAAPVEYFLRHEAGPQTGTLLDFSPGGARLSSDRAVPVHTVLALKTPLFDALARVVGCQPSGWRRGWQLRVQFLTLALTAPAGCLVSTRV